MLRITPEKHPAALPAPLLLMGPVALVPLPVLGSIFKEEDAAFQGELPCGLPMGTCQEPKHHPKPSGESKSCTVRVENELSLAVLPFSWLGRRASQRGRERAVLRVI